MKEKAWRGEFTNLNLLLKSARELANDNNVQGGITLRGNSLTVVNKSTKYTRMVVCIYDLCQSNARKVS